jgi:hypothetical protein
MPTGGRGGACVAHVRAVGVVGPNRRPEAAGASAEARFGAERSSPLMMPRKRLRPVLPRKQGHPATQPPRSTTTRPGRARPHTGRATRASAEARAEPRRTYGSTAQADMTPGSTVPTVAGGVVSCVYGSAGCGGRRSGSGGEQVGGVEAEFLVDHGDDQVEVEGVVGGPEGGGEYGRLDRLRGFGGLGSALEGW